MSAGLLAMTTKKIMAKKSATKLLNEDKKLTNFSFFVMLQFIATAFNCDILRG